MACINCTMEICSLLVLACDSDHKVKLFWIIWVALAHHIFHTPLLNYNIFVCKESSITCQTTLSFRATKI